MPSEAYLPLFKDFWIQHRIFHLAVTMALKNQAVTQSAFLLYLETPEQQFNLLADRIVGRSLTRDDFNSENIVCNLPSQLG